MVVAKHVWEGKDIKDFDNWPQVETGPYKFNRYYKRLNMFVWERDEDYWAKKCSINFPDQNMPYSENGPSPDIDIAALLEAE